MLSLLLLPFAVSVNFLLDHPAVATASYAPSAANVTTEAAACAQCFCGTTFADAETRCHAPCTDGTDAPCLKFAGEKCFAGCTGCAGVPTPAPPPPPPPPPAPSGPCVCPNCKAPQSTPTGSWLFFVWKDGTTNIYEYFSSTSGTMDVYLMDAANYAKLKAGGAFTYDASHSRKGVTCFNDSMPVLPQGELYRVARCVASATGACQIAAVVFSGGGPPPPPPAPSPPSKGGDFCGTSFTDANSRCHAACPGGLDAQCKAFAGEKCFASCSGCAGVPTPAPPPPPAPPAPTPGKTHYGDPHKATCLAGELITTINGASGNFCDPPCPGGVCPADKPAGMLATPTCLLNMQGQTTKYCALVCNGAAGSVCAAGATCKAVNGMNLCTYDS